MSRRKIEGYIAEFLGIGQRDSRMVLRAIESQHGLLIKRSQKVWSFSHLTFQEYFNTREIINNYNPNTLDNQALQGLVTHLTEKRWQEVFVLAAGMLRSADCLLQLMKHQVDTIVASDSKLQTFLIWLNEKALSVNVPDKPAVVRSFYITLIQDIENTLARDLDLKFAIVEDLGCDLNLDRELLRDLKVARDLTLKNDHDFLFLLTLKVKIKFKECQSQTLYNWLEKLKSQLPNIPIPDTEYLEWWQTKGVAWTDQLRTVMIQHRNIGHEWQFSDEQKELLKQYYDANLLLVNCLNSDCYVSREVRQEIEDTLLLPMSEIDKTVTNVRN